jgi:hypothetical protein
LPQWPGDGGARVIPAGGTRHAVAAASVGGLARAFLANARGKSQDLGDLKATEKDLHQVIFKREIGCCPS